MNTRQIERRFEVDHVNYLRDKWGYPMVQEPSRWAPAVWLALLFLAGCSLTWILL